MASWQTSGPRTALRRDWDWLANWCNVRLIVVGRRPVVLEFSKRARVQPSSVFGPDMLQGEGQDLFAERMRRIGPHLSMKKYVFQVRNDDGLNHFREVSRRCSSLYFVLAYHDPNVGEYGSYLIRQGRSRAYAVPEGLIDSVLSRHGVDYDADDDENEGRYWEASWEIMDQAESRWLARFVRRAGPRDA